MLTDIVGASHGTRPESFVPLLKMNSIDPSAVPPNPIGAESLLE
jgi:hypothetical protein